MDEDFSIAVSPRHSVRLAMEYRHLIEKPPRRDFCVRTITRRQANGTPLMAAEIVIAGEDARKELPLAATYPLHFKKTYYPARIHGDPKVEYDRQLDASRLIAVTPPIGSTHDTFRACMIPGSTLTTLLPFQTEPEDRNLHHARELADIPTEEIVAEIERDCGQSWDETRRERERGYYATYFEELRKAYTLAASEGAAVGILIC